MLHRQGVIAAFCPADYFAMLRRGVRAQLAHKVCNIEERLPLVMLLRPIRGARRALTTL